MKDHPETGRRGLKRFGIAACSGLLVVGLTPTFTHIALADSTSASSQGEKKTIEVEIANQPASNAALPESLKQKPGSEILVTPGENQTGCPALSAEGDVRKTTSGDKFVFTNKLGFTANQNPTAETTCSYTITLKKPEGHKAGAVIHDESAYKLEWKYAPGSEPDGQGGTWSYKLQKFDNKASADQKTEELGSDANESKIAFLSYFKYWEVTFTKDEHSAVISKQLVANGDNVTEVPTSGQCGNSKKIFNGWLKGGVGDSLSDEQVKSSQHKPTSYVTYQASCITPFEVTYQDNQGKQVGVARINPKQRDVDPQVLTDGTKLSQKKLCAAGKIPSGKWVQVKKGGNDTNNPEAKDFPGPIDADYTLKADCQAGVSVKFNANGGTFQAAAVKDINHYALDAQNKVLTITYAKGTNLSAPQDGLVRDGYKLLGWSKTAGATQPDQDNPLPTHFPQESIEKPFYAVWEQNPSGSNPAAPTPGNTATPSPGSSATPTPGNTATPSPGSSTAPSPSNPATPTPDNPARPAPSGPSASSPSSSSGGSSLGSSSDSNTSKDKADKDKQQKAEKEKAEKEKAAAKELAQKTAVTKFDKEFNTLVKLPAKSVQRAAGANRVETSLSALSLVKNRETVVLATGNSFPDALVGGALAGAMKAGVVLTTAAGGLEPAVLSQLKAQGTKTVNIVGGYSAVAKAKEEALRAAGFEVIRIAGANRYETAQAVKNATRKALGLKAGARAKVSCNATGANFPDALACASAASLMGGTVDLVKPGQAVAPDASAERTICAGGQACAAAGGNVTKVVGANRYETAYRIAQLAPATGKVVVANASSVAADSLVASALSASTGARLVLSNGKRVNVPEGTKSAHIIGGQNAIPDNLPMFTK